MYNPWVHRIDFSYKHDFKLNLGSTSHKLQLGFDVKNVLNLFNSKWGVMKVMNSSLNEGRILRYDHTDAEGYPCSPHRLPSRAASRPSCPTSPPDSAGMPLSVLSITSTVFLQNTKQL